MGGAIEHVGIGPEDVLRAVAVMHVEIDDRHPLGVIALARVIGGDGRLVEEAEAHGAVLLGMVAGRAHGAEGILGLGAEHRIDGGGRSPHGAQGRLQRVGRHHRIGVDVFEAALGGDGHDLLHMLGRMGHEELLLDGARRLTPQGCSKVGRLQHRIDRLDAVDALGMAGRRFMAEAGPVGVNEGRHGPWCSRGRAPLL